MLQRVEADVLVIQFQTCTGPWSEWCLGVLQSRCPGDLGFARVKETLRYYSALFLLLVFTGVQGKNRLLVGACH
jgi:hypothetical protein